MFRAKAAAGSRLPATSHNSHWWIRGSRRRTESRFSWNSASLRSKALFGQHRIQLAKTLPRSASRSSSHLPDSRFPRSNPPIRTRISRKVGWPMAAVIRRTCRFLPSMSSRPIQKSRTFFLNRTGGILGGGTGCGSSAQALHGSDFSPRDISIPAPRNSSFSGVGIRSTSAQ